MAVASFFYLALGTNNYHHLFYENVTLASDPMYSFTTVRGPLFYAFFAVALTELLWPRSWSGGRTGTRAWPKGGG